MTVQRSAIVLLGALVMMAMTGCISDTLGSGVHEVPTWHVGDLWTYGSVRTHEVKYDGDHPYAETEVITMEMVQTVVASERLDGRPVHWMTFEGGVPEGASMRSTDDDSRTMFAYDPATLFPTAYVSWSTLRCGDDGPVRAWEDPEPFRLLDFPLVKGKSWETRDHLNSFHAIVGGSKPIKVPAGTFEAVRIDLRLIVQDPDVDAAADDPISDTGPTVVKRSGMATAWYAPAVKNVVRIDSHTDIVTRDEGSTHFASVVTETVLQRYGPEQDSGHMPEIAFDGWEQPDITTFESVEVDPPYQIVSDPSLPIDLADSRSVRFGLARGSDTELPSSPLYDLERYDLFWTLLEGSTERIVHEPAGPVLEVDLTPGRFTVAARFVPAGHLPSGEGCSWSDPYGTVRPIVAPRAFEANWSKTFTIEVSAGAEEILDLGMMPSGRGQGEVVVTIAVQHVSPFFSDTPELVLRGPDGEKRFHQDGGFSLRAPDPAEWSLEWHPNGMEAESGHALMLGHTATVHLEVRH